MSGKVLLNRIFQGILFLLGFYLCWRFFEAIDSAQLFAIIQKGKIWPVILVAVFSLLVYIVRSLRWNLLFDATSEPQADLYAAFSSLSLGYLISFFVPRAGEVLRCGLMKRYKNTSFPLSLGTVITERIVDVIMLLLTLIAVLFVSNHAIIRFADEFMIIPVSDKLHAFSMWQLLLVGLLLLVLVFAIFKYIYPHLHSRSRKAFESVREGLTSVLHLKKPLRFLAYTLIIWIGYFMMTWLWLFMFDETDHISLDFVFFIFVIGTVGRSIPINGGGAGAYHFLVTQAFAIAGCSLMMGQSMAIIIHGGQTLFTLLAAIIGLPRLLMSYRTGTSLSSAPDSQE